jgi:hypothetical protein
MHLYNDLTFFEKVVFAYRLVRQGRKALRVGVLLLEFDEVLS